MNAIVRCAEEALREHPHPALRLTELRDLVAGHLDRPVDSTLLRSLLEEHPDRFRVLDPWRGPWRSTLDDGRRGDSARPRRLDPWVMVVDDPGCRGGESRGAALKLRESVRWLGRGVDPRSSSDVRRWTAIALAERDARCAVTKKAA